MQALVSQKVHFSGATPNQSQFPKGLPEM